MIAPNIETHMLRTYSSLRRLMAFVTLAFLITLSIYRCCYTDSVKRNSISAYYYHDNAGVPMHDVFVVGLCALGVLLVAYQGYTRYENWALNFAGSALVIVANFPMDWPPAEGGKPGAHWPNLSWHANIHYAAAVAFFAFLAYVCWFRADDTLRAVDNPKRRSIYRYLYRLNGLLMAGVPVLALALHLAGKSDSVYYTEYAGVVVFLLYWVIKSIELHYTQLETEGAPRKKLQP